MRGPARRAPALVAECRRCRPDRRMAPLGNPRWQRGWGAPGIDMPLA